MSRANYFFLALCIIFSFAFFIPNQSLANQVGHWRFDNKSGTIALDSSGNGHNGTLKSGPTWSPGKINGSLDFDGSNDYVNVGISPFFNITGDLTIAAWIFHDSSEGPDNVVGHGDCFVSTCPYGVRISRSDKLCFDQGHNLPLKDSLCSAPGSVPLGQWAHVAVTRQGDRRNLYINGMRAAGQVVQERAPMANNRPLVIGNNDAIGHAPFDGKIDHVYIYDHALTEGEIQKLISPGGKIDNIPPSIPVALKISVTSSSQINLSWGRSTDNVAVAGYHIYRDGLLIDTVNSTSYADVGLSPDTIYNYRVDAFDAAGNVSNRSVNITASTFLKTTMVRVAMAQMKSIDGDIPAALAKAEHFIRRASAAGANIVVFPELFDVGFENLKLPTGGEHAEPIPGPTSNALGALAAQYNIWISGALLEETLGGVFDTNVIIDSKGKVVLKQRKAFVGPFFGGEIVYQGNFHDAQVIESPWGPIGVMNCVDTANEGKRLFFAKQKPSLMLVNLANPQTNLLDNLTLLSQECNCPSVGANMVFPNGNWPVGQEGGESRFVDQNGKTLWQGPNGIEAFRIMDLSVNTPTNRMPYVTAGDVQTIRLPNNTVTLSGSVVDDDLPRKGLLITWSKISGPGNVIFTRPNSEVTDVKFTAAGVYRLRLTADDGATSSSDDVAINVLPPVGDLNLAGHWTFDRTTNDKSGLNNHGKIVGRPKFSTDIAPTGSQNTHSIDLDGINDYIKVNHHLSLDASEYVTMTAWIKPRSYPSFYPNKADWAQIIGKGNVWEQQNYMMGWGGYFYFHSDSMGMRVANLDDIVRTPNQWHHVAVVIDATKNRGQVFINGLLDQTVFSVATVFANSNPLFIGTAQPSSPDRIDGRIDDVKLYTRALSSDEIAALVPNTIPNEAPFVDAGLDVTARVSTPISLRGNYMDDYLPATSAISQWTYWKKISGPGDVNFGNRFALSTTAAFTQAGTYVIELQGSDAGHLIKDQLTVTVTP